MCAVGAVHCPVRRETGSDALRAGFLILDLIFEILRLIARHATSSAQMSGQQMHGTLPCASVTIRQ